MLPGSDLGQTGRAAGELEHRDLLGMHGLGRQGSGAVLDELLEGRAVADRLTTRNDHRREGACGVQVAGDFQGLAPTVVRLHDRGARADVLGQRADLARAVLGQGAHGTQSGDECAEVGDECLGDVAHLEHHRLAGFEIGGRQQPRTEVPGALCEFGVAPPHLRGDQCEPVCVAVGGVEDLLGQRQAAPETAVAVVGDELFGIRRQPGIGIGPCGLGGRDG